jgi:hypothetical protein
MRIAHYSEKDIRIHRQIESERILRNWNVMAAKADPTYMCKIPTPKKCVIDIFENSVRSTREKMG